LVVFRPVFVAEFAGAGNRLPAALSVRRALPAHAKFSARCVSEVLALVWRHAWSMAPPPHRFKRRRRRRLAI